MVTRLRTLFRDKDKAIWADDELVALRAEAQTQYDKAVKAARGCG